MIMIAEIYQQMGISDFTPPHYFELENIAEMFIPLDKKEQTEIIHLIPKAQNLSSFKIDSLLQISQGLVRAYENTKLLLSRGGASANSGTTGSVGEVLRFHILSASNENESATAFRLLEFFAAEMEVARV